jgi:hypothetical protein
VSVNADARGEQGPRERPVKVFLTATVTPQVLRDLHIQDPQVRRQQYVESLRRWVPLAARYGAGVVFFENSGADLDRLALDAFGRLPDNLRLVNAPPPTAEDIGRGKGSAEASMMDQFCQEFFDDPDEVWYKCTGRLFVKNFARCVPSPVPPRSVIARFSKNLVQMDTRFFGATAGVWRDHFLGTGPDVYDPDKMFLEKVLMRRVLIALGEGACLLRFGAQPNYHGRSGTHADRRYDSLGSRVKRVGANRLENVLRGPLRGKQY